LTVPDDRLARAVAAIDAANADDPNTVVVPAREQGVTRPKELAHAELMTAWVSRLRPDASEALLLAARAHHIRRWVVPRSSYPEGRAGYLRWRRDLHERHATDVGVILDEAGYDATMIARVQDIVRKRNLARDPEVQVLEDALCLVFIETQFAELAAKLDRPKMVDVVRKTLKKMSAQGQAMALSLELPADDRTLIEEATRA
jgi:hypothetical protein